MPDELSEKVIGAAIEVHRVLGPGLLESIYENALVHECGLQGMTCDRQLGIDVLYKGELVGAQRLDILIEKELIVEVKSLQNLPEVATAQLISYLEATNLKRGLLINFGMARLVDGIRRISI